ncbi:MAG: hypothetical protein ACLGI6_03605 [Gammaproteobacteria bacterium]
MDSNQRSQANNQSSNGGNEKSVNSTRGGLTEKDNINPEVQRSGTLHSDTPVHQQSSGSGSQMGAQESTDRTASQTGNRQEVGPGVHQSNDAAGGYPRSPGVTPQEPTRNLQKDGPGVHQSNDAAGGYPRSPGGANKLSGSEKMDDDTGFSRGPGG